jgi:hypothetical protein
VNTKETKLGVTNTSEIVAYNNSNGLPSISRTIVAGGKKLLTKTTYAHDCATYSAAMGPDGTHILTAPAQVVVYEKAANDNTTTVVPTEVRSANVTSYSNTLGNNIWMPWKDYKWKADIKSDGTPDKTYADFLFTPGATNPNWICINTIERCAKDNKIVQSSNAKQTKGTIVYRADNGLAVASISSAGFTEASVFTGDYRIGNTPGYWDYENGWEKGDDTKVTLSTDAGSLHFGQNVLHVINDYAAGRNNRIYPGKSYIMTAWVKVTSGRLFMAAGYHCRNANENNPWHIPWGTYRVLV